MARLILDYKKESGIAALPRFERVQMACAFVIRASGLAYGSVHDDVVLSGTALYLV
jgi:hypothetical protein